MYNIVLFPCYFIFCCFVVRCMLTYLLIIFMYPVPVFYLSHVTTILIVLIKDSIKYCDVFFFIFSFMKFLAHLLIQGSCEVIPSLGIHPLLSVNFYISIFLF